MAKRPLRERRLGVPVRMSEQAIARFGMSRLCCPLAAQEGAAVTMRRVIDLAWDARKKQRPDIVELITRGEGLPRAAPGRRRRIIDLPRRARTRLRCSLARFVQLFVARARRGRTYRCGSSPHPHVLKTRTATGPHPLPPRIVAAASHCVNPCCDGNQVTG